MRPLHRGAATAAALLLSAYSPNRLSAQRPFQATDYYKLVVVANPALQPPFTDASEIVVSGPDDGTIVLANGFGSHGETVKRTRDRDGHVCELAGGTLVPEDRGVVELTAYEADPVSPRRA